MKRLLLSMLVMASAFSIEAKAAETVEVYTVAITSSKITDGYDKDTYSFFDSKMERLRFTESTRPGYTTVRLNIFSAAGTHLKQTKLEDLGVSYAVNNFIALAKAATPQCPLNVIITKKNHVIVDAKNECDDNL